MTIINLKWNSKCNKCNRELKKGEEAEWQKGRGLLCLDCLNKQGERDLDISEIVSKLVEIAVQLAGLHQKLDKSLKILEEGYEKASGEKVN